MNWLRKLFCEFDGRLYRVVNLYCDSCENDMYIAFLESELIKRKGNYESLIQDGYDISPLIKKNGVNNHA